MKYRTVLAAILAIACVAPVAAQTFNQSAYCEAMGEQANNGVITIPIAQETLMEIYRRGQAGTNKPMFQLLLTGEGDPTPYSDWLEEACNGLSLQQG